MTHVHRFLPGEHDATVCLHVLAGRSYDGSVEHTDYPDGSVEVTYPLSDEDVLTALRSYEPKAYVNEPVVLTDEEVAVLKEIASREKEVARVTRDA